MAFSVEQFKAAFFDRQALGSAIDRGAKQALSKFGAFVRRRDKSSLKYRKAASSAGQPPTVHRFQGFTHTKKNRKTGAVSKHALSPLRELTFFAYDADNQSTIIGPAIFKKSKIGGGIAPKVIEEGGTARMLSHGKPRVGHFAARPHLGPAFQAELPKAAQLLKDRIR